MREQKGREPISIRHGFRVQQLAWAAGYSLAREAGLHVRENLTGTPPLLKDAPADELVNILTTKISASKRSERNLAEMIVAEAINLVADNQGSLSPGTMRALAKFERRLAAISPPTS